MALDERSQRSVEVEGHPDLEALLAVVEREGSCELTRHGEVVARVGGVALTAAEQASRRPPGWRPSAEELAAFRAAAGSWDGLVDDEALIERIYADREASMIRHFDVDGIGGGDRTA